VRQLPSLAQIGVAAEQPALSRQATHWPAFAPDNWQNGVDEERIAQALSSPMPLQARHVLSVPHTGAVAGQSVEAVAGVHGLMPVDMSTPPSKEATQRLIDRSHTGRAGSWH
jgi:hypothetical protein